MLLRTYCMYPIVLYVTYLPLWHETIVGMGEKMPNDDKSNSTTLKDEAVENWPVIKRMHDHINSHGEVHATFEGLDKEVELRKGPTTFRYNDGVINVHGKNELHYFSMDSLQNWYAPTTVFHD